MKASTFIMTAFELTWSVMHINLSLIRVVYIYMKNWIEAKAETCLIKTYCFCFTEKPKDRCGSKYILILYVFAFSQFSVYFGGWFLQFQHTNFCIACNNLLAGTSCCHPSFVVSSYIRLGNRNTRHNKHFRPVDISLLRNAE